MLMMGGLYMYVGSALYVWQVIKLRQGLRLGPVAVRWSMFNAAWPTALWSVSLACLLDETPGWLLEGLRLVGPYLPGVLYASLFVPSTSLQPIIGLLHRVQTDEQSRLRYRWDNPLLADDDYAMIIHQRVDRLEALEKKIAALCEDQQLIPSAQAMPLLDKLQAAAEQLQQALDAEVSRLEDASWLTRGLRLLGLKQDPRVVKLQEEVKGVRMLVRRCIAVKSDSELVE